ncbi:hypothetical protein C9382_29690 [Pseudomonas aylmerensis]|uniref:Uncharacterized protein n=1 Tax=Pseudomonas aylmerensis TaxID=1869229 RepID=A0A2T4FK95_9PSED|nr:hypothetical protein C9382_29690 [Pseudomonas aylmerensis]
MTLNPVGAGLPAMQTTRSSSWGEVMLSQASQLPQVGLCPTRLWGASAETSDSFLRLSLGHSISSLRTPLKTQRTGVAARIPIGH